MPSRAQMEAFALRWGPFGSIASMYLLRVADNVNAVFLRLGIDNNKNKNTSLLSI